MMLPAAIGVLLVLTGLSSCLDTEGTQFTWTYVRNADRNVSLPHQQLSVTVMNGANTVSCDFTVLYKDDFTSPFKTKTLSVAPGSASEMSIPAYYGFAYDTLETPQADQIPKVTLTANASCPVTVVANNYDSVTQQGDSFLVLPTRWASRWFSFSLPPANPSQGQYQQISFLPVDQNAHVTMTSLEHGNPMTFNVTFGDESTVYFATATPDKTSRSYRIVSDVPIQLVAGVTCVGVTGGQCDHAAFMPHPLPSNDCRETVWLDDDHATDLVSTASFYMDIPSTCTSQQTVNAKGLKKVSIDVQLTNQKKTQLQTFDQNSFGRALNVHADTAPIHMTRVYDQSGTAGRRGAFLTTVPSQSQFITNGSYFYTRNNGDTLELICESKACFRTYIDGTNMMSLSKDYDTVSIDDDSFFSFTVIIAQAGFHQITFTDNASMGTYTYYVVGKNSTSSYGYEGALNLPRIIPATATTTTSIFPPTGTTTPVVTTATPSTNGVTTPTTNGATSSTLISSTTGGLSSTTAPSSSTGVTTPSPSTPSSISSSTTATTIGVTSTASSSSSTSSVTTSTPPSTSSPYVPTSTITVMTQGTSTSTAVPITSTTVQTTSTQGQTTSTAAPTTTTPNMSPSTTTPNLTPTTTTQNMTPSTTTPTSTPTTTTPTLTPSTTTPTTTTPTTTTPTTTTPTLAPTSSTTSTTAIPVTTSTSTAAPITTSTTPPTPSTSTTPVPSTSTTTPPSTSTTPPSTSTTTTVATTPTDTPITNAPPVTPAPTTPPPNTDKMGVTSGNLAIYTTIAISTIMLWKQIM